MNTKIYLTVLIGLSTLAGCATSSNQPVNSSTDSANANSAASNTIEADTAGVLLADTKQTILGASYSPYTEEKKDGYKKFEFTDIAGTCADQGLADFAYLYNEDLKYFGVESLDGAYKDTSISMTDSRLNYMEDVPLNGGPAACDVAYAFGKNEGTVTCKVADAEVCTATATITAYKQL